MTTRCPTHPGELLREDILPDIGISKAEFARRLYVSRQTVYDILNEKAAVTPNLALRLGKLFGNSPLMWVNMQNSYDLWNIEKEQHDELNQIHSFG